jgi:transposase
VLRKHECLSDGISAPIGLTRASILDPYLEFIKVTIEEFPEICSSRVFDMIRQKGYPGTSSTHVRRAVNQIRPSKNKEAFLRLSMLPGDQAQVDWADFGSVTFGKHQRKLSAFVMTLSHSRMIFLKFFYGMKMREFKQGHMDAFEFFEGVPGKVLHDNLKTGVSERLGKLIRFNDQFLEFASHYSFIPKAANIRRGNEKGRVERAIQYVRTSFFEGRKWVDIGDLNGQAIEWCLDLAADRPWAQDRTLKVREVFEAEKKHLHKLPSHRFPAWERVQVSIPKTPYARYDGNDYSVPPKYVQSNVEVCADENTVCIFANDLGVEQIAEHKRSYGKQVTIENPEHIAEILKHKKAGVEHAGLNKVTNDIKSSGVFLQRLAERGENLGGAVSSLLKMIRNHGAEMVACAVSEVVETGSCNLRSVHFVLTRLEQSGKIKSVMSAPFCSEKHANLSVQHHDPKLYDKLTGITET